MDMRPQMNTRPKVDIDPRWIPKPQMDIGPRLAIVGGVAHLFLVHEDGKVGPIKQFLIDLLCGALQREGPTPIFFFFLRYW